jgi:hypothetical protein
MTVNGDLKVRNAKDLDREERARLFQHGIHEEGVFYSRLNFFLLFESLLFASALSGFGNDGPPIEVTAVVCGVGFGGSVLWWYAQANKLVLLKTLEDRLVEGFDEFRESVGLADRKRVVRVWSANTVLTWAFPLLFAAAWVCLFCYLPFRADWP